MEGFVFDRSERRFTESLVGGELYILPHHLLNNLGILDKYLDSVEATGPLVKNSIQRLREDGSFGALSIFDQERISHDFWPILVAAGMSPSLYYNDDVIGDIGSAKEQRFSVNMIDELTAMKVALETADLYGHRITVGYDNRQDHTCRGLCVQHCHAVLAVNLHVASTTQRRGHKLTDAEVVMRAYDWSKLGEILSSDPEYIFDGDVSVAVADRGDLIKGVVNYLREGSLQFISRGFYANPVNGRNYPIVDFSFPFGDLNRRLSNGKRLFTAMAMTDPTSLLKDQSLREKLREAGWGNTVATNRMDPDPEVLAQRELRKRIVI